MKIFIISTFNIKENKEHKQYIFTSPATGMDIIMDDSWEFNGDMDSQTFSPSILVEYPKENPKTGHVREHFFITNGKIHYLKDCNHDMAGKTVDMIDCKWCLQDKQE